MATVRRLSDGDVRSIFESLHENKPPPSSLKFQIIPVGPNGLKLSPPSYEFPDGLYVLLKPEKKRKNYDPSTSQWMEKGHKKCPSHLRRFFSTEMHSKGEICPWSLSGPQFPQPTAIQQRYCYPKGDPDYSGQKGGALWTMYGRDGKEDVEFRLLHVYFSAKRAVNKGVRISSSRAKSLTPPYKRRKTIERSIRSPWQERPKPGTGIFVKQDTGSFDFSHLPGSEDGFTAANSNIQVLQSTSPCYTTRRGNHGNHGVESAFVSPGTAASELDNHDQHSHHDLDQLLNHNDDGFDTLLGHRSFHPLNTFDLDHRRQLPSTGGQTIGMESNQQQDHQYSELFRSRPQPHQQHQEHVEQSLPAVGASKGEDESMINFTTSDLENWNDPFLNSIMANPSVDPATDLPPVANSAAENKDAESLRTTSDGESTLALGRSLFAYHENVLQNILAPNGLSPPQRSALIGLYSEWGAAIARNPMDCSLDPLTVLGRLQIEDARDGAPPDNHDEMMEENEDGMLAASQMTAV